VPKVSGFSKDARIRAKQTKMLDAYAEQAGSIGEDKAKDEQAMIVAVERAGYTRATTDRAKIRQFMKLWKSDASRAYLCELWGLAVEPQLDRDPVSLAMRLLHEHAVQDDTEKWGPRDRSVSLSATKEMVKLFIPAQTTKVQSLNLSAKIERPAQFDVEPEMKPRAILPAGQQIAATKSPIRQGEEDDDDEEDDDE
jgi:hypothetical protein